MKIIDPFDVLAARHARVAAEDEFEQAIVELTSHWPTPRDLDHADRLTALDAAITICPVCDMRVIRPHRHAMEASAS